MSFKISRKTVIFIFANTILISCSNHHSDKMTDAETSDIAKNVKDIYGKMTEYSEGAQLDSFLSYYDNSPAFLHISSDGKMRNYAEFKKICTEYYTTLKRQKVSTIMEKYNVMDPNFVIVGWTGTIIAEFKNGDIMNMNNYSITNMFKKIDGKWKIIHSHESALPPEIIKKG
ncbi:MAG: nuclear transport factor 2 family protein [Chitinophagales bacterium]